MRESDPPACVTARQARPEPPEPAIMPVAEPSPEGRVAIENVSPEIDGGRAAAKCGEGMTFVVEADIFSDGCEVIAADLLWQDASLRQWRRAAMHFVENDRWAGQFIPPKIGRYHYSIEAWRDPFATWRRDVQKRIAAGHDVSLEIEEGRALVERAAGEGREGLALDELRERLALAKPEDRLTILLDAQTAHLLAHDGPRESVSYRLPVLDVVVDRRAAIFSAWYELFPRSQSGDCHRHGTFQDVIGKLPYIRDLGFDVLSFPPIHPIGRTHRRGRDNAMNAAIDDPGCVYAIGATEGGHLAIHPQLGTLADFRRLVAAARAQQIEIALDFAVQCSPDHPWVREHPDWFDWRPDGTVKCAESPPKKHEDIVNFQFEGEAFPALWHALRDVICFWIENGVRIFRVNDPQSKPLPFWQWLIREVNDDHPDVTFLAEAFTRPKMMKKLAKIGFQQSYTYFTWRNHKQELTEYMQELTGEMATYYRPNFFVNTPDINPWYLQTSGRPGFIVRATLAATLSSVWGMYHGFEVCEAQAIAGREEYQGSEKYELRALDLDRPGNIKDHIRALNRIRRTNPALQDFGGFLALNSSNDQVLVYARLTPQRENCVLVIVNLDPFDLQRTEYEIPLWEFDLPDWSAVEAEDLLHGNRFTLHGKAHVIDLDPQHSPVAVWRLYPPSWSLCA